MGREVGVAISLKSKSVGALAFPGVEHPFKLPPIIGSYPVKRQPPDFHGISIRHIRDEIVWTEHVVSTVIAFAYLIRASTGPGRDLPSQVHHGSFQHLLVGRRHRTWQVVDTATAMLIGAPG
jgi:hypothetical protein